MPRRDGTGPQGNGPKTGRRTNMAENQCQDQEFGQRNNKRQTRGMGCPVGRGQAVNENSRGYGQNKRKSMGAEIEGTGKGLRCGRKSDDNRAQGKVGQCGFGRRRNEGGCGRNQLTETE